MAVARKIEKLKVDIKYFEERIEVNIKAIDRLVGYRL